MSFFALTYFYRRRLRTHPVQELLAGLGIAAGVALVFAVQVANSSITGASGQIVRSIVGTANLQLRARGPEGLPESAAERVQGLPGVREAAPVLDLPATVQGPNGKTVVVQVASAGASLAVLDGLARSIPVERLQPDTVMLPRATARGLGVSTMLSAEIAKPLPTIILRVRGRAVPVRVSVVLGPETVGTLSGAMTVIAPLRMVQRIAGLPGRISRVLVQAQSGRQSQVRRELQRIAAGRLTVAPATDDIRLLEQATVPNNESTGFFAFVSALVGLLLAFNAMLLSAPERRRVIADLRIQGTRPRDLVRLLMFQAVCLGAGASLVGVLVGDVLSHGIFHQAPGYLAAAFPLGTQTVIGWQPLLFSFAGGVAATCLAAAPPLLDLRKSHAVDGVYFDAGEPGHAMSPRSRIRLFLAGLTLIVASTGAWLVLGPAAAVVAIVGLVLAALLAIPFSFTVVVWAAQLAAAKVGRLNLLLIATRGLRATTVRSLALAATGAVAVFGSVAAEGAHRDLLKGLYGDYAQYVSTADLWITNPGDELATNSFPDAGLSARIRRLPGVKIVRAYQGGFLDVAGRRVWLIARSPGAPAMFPRGQLVRGTPGLASSRLRAGGWITLSEQIAKAAHLKIGQRFTLPTPSGPIAYRLAATTTNLGWAGGAVVLNENDYRGAWKTTDPSALEVDVKPGMSVLSVKRQIETVIGGRGGGLRVQSSPGRATQADVLAREGLSRLTQIALLLMIAAALAMAAAMGASVWQRRPSLASLRLQSYKPSQLRIVLLCESLLVLGTGAVTGALAGMYGHELIDRYLRLVTGFPAPFSTAGPQMLQTILVIVGAATVVLAIPGFIASRVPPSLALQE